MHRFGAKENGDQVAPDRRFQVFPVIRTKRVIERPIHQALHGQRSTTKSARPARDYNIDPPNLSLLRASN
jgi:hypothetical protein